MTATGVLTQGPPQRALGRAGTTWGPELHVEWVSGHLLRNWTEGSLIQAPLRTPGEGQGCPGRTTVSRAVETVPSGFQDTVGVSESKSWGHPLDASEVGEEPLFPGSVRSSPPLEGTGVIPSS